jgi:hypothetical protein
VTKLVLLFMLVACGVVVGAEKPKQPVTDNFKTPLEIIQTVPSNMYPTDVKGWTALKMDAVNDVLKDKTKGKTVTFETIVKEVKVVKEAEPDFRLNVIGKPVAVGSTKVQVWYYFDEDQKAKLAGLNPDDKLSITGTISNPRFAKVADGVPLIIDVYHCEIVASKTPGKK